MEIEMEKKENDMDVEEEKQSSKRKVTNLEDEDAAEQERQDAELVNFFGEFRVPTLFWGVYSMIENMGLLYLHNKTSKPIMLIRRVNAETFKVVGYNLYCQADEEKKADRVGVFKFNLENMGDTEEERTLYMMHSMDQVAAQYTLEGVLTDEEAIRNVDHFLQLLELDRLDAVEHTEESFKKRRIGS